MATLTIFAVGGTLFGGGIGFILGYFTGKRHGRRGALQQGFPLRGPSV
jgi:hypothetical protein